MKIRDATSPALLLAMTMLASACATLDRRSVAETHRLHGDAHYVDLASARPTPGACAVVMPVTLDPELQEAFGYADRRAELQPIVDAVNARLARRASPCTPLSSRAVDAAGPPRVYVGTADSEHAPPEAAEQRLPTDRFAPMVLHLERPSPLWREQAAGLARAAGTPYVIVMQLGVSQYAKGYSGPFRKSVQLGTGHRQPLRFLTAEDKPVEVLHLTGVLIDAGGQAVRAGAEGIVLRDTPFMAQAFDMSRMLDALELRSVLADARRTDLPGAPRSLDVALDNLVAQLTRSAPLVPST